jgi:hypothetical protein
VPLSHVGPCEISGLKIDINILVIDRRAILPRRWFEIVVVLVAVMAAFVPTSPRIVERWFATGAYPRVQRVLTSASNVLPVPWLDLLSTGALLWLAWTWWRALRPGDDRRVTRVAAATRRTVVSAACVYLAFLLLWGFNYRRLPMASRLEIGANPPSTEEVVKLGLIATERANTLHARAHLAGWREPVWRDEALQRSYRNVQARLTDAPDAVPGRLKRTLFGAFLRWTSVDGMVNPFGLEVLANPDLLPFERPFVTAHEWAHLAGYAHEAEANFVGWLTCMGADEPAQYSGWLFLYWQVAGELNAKEREQVAATLADGPRRDLAAVASRLRRGDLPMLRRASWAMYDRYLKANRVEAGIRSYGAVVTLILRARFEDDWRPVRRAFAAPGP